MLALVLNLFHAFKQQTAGSSFNSRGEPTVFWRLKGAMYILFAYFTYFEAYSQVDF